MNPSLGSTRNDVVLAITSIVTALDPAGAGLDLAEAESGVAIQMLNANSTPPAIRDRAASRKRG
jgi:hypothetical protein